VATVFREPERYASQFGELRHETRVCWCGGPEMEQFWMQGGEGAVSNWWFQTGFSRECDGLNAINE